MYHILQAAALFKVLKETPPIPEILSADGKDFLQCCFRRNPADRPTASKLLDHPFVNYSSQFDARTQSLKEIRLTVKYLAQCPCFSIKYFGITASLFLFDDSGDYASVFMIQDTMQFLKERQCQRFDKVPASLDKQIKKGKLASK